MEIAPPFRERKDAGGPSALIERLDKESISSDVIPACLKAHWNLRGLPDEVNSLERRMKSERGKDDGGRGARKGIRANGKPEDGSPAVRSVSISLRLDQWHRDGRGLWIFAIAPTNLDRCYLASANGVASIAVIMVARALSLSLLPSSVYYRENSLVN